MIEAGVTEDVYEHLDEWRTWPGYTDRQRLAIEYAERFATDHRAIDDELFARLRAQFADDEILDLTLCCAVFLGLGRTLEVLGITDNDDCPLEHLASGVVEERVVQSDDRARPLGRRAGDRLRRDAGCAIAVVRTRCAMSRRA